MANTPNLNLPLIDAAATADVPRDMNALANGIDGKAGAAGGLATLGADGKVPASQLSVTQPPDATTTTKGVVQLNDATNSTSTTQAATANAVKKAYDRADAAFTSASDGKGKVRTAIIGVKGTVADADGDGVPTYDELVAGVQSIPAGFTADATVVAGDIRSGKTAYKGGTKVTGSLVTQATGAQTITPGTSNIVKPAGIYDGAITVLGDADLIASNIKSGVNIFGVVGSLIEGKRMATGSKVKDPNTNSAAVFTVSGLAFRPSLVVALVNFGDVYEFVAVHDTYRNDFRVIAYTPYNQQLVPNTDPYGTERTNSRITLTTNGFIFNCNLNSSSSPSMYFTAIE